MGDNESLCFEKFIIDYGFDHIDDFPNFTNIDEGKEVIIIPDDEAREYFNESLFNHVYDKFTNRIDGVDSFVFNYDTIQAGKFILN